MEQSAAGSPRKPEWPAEGVGRATRLLTAYQEVLKALAGIMEFRAKLLALLPLASGTGIYLLLNGGTNTVAPQLLIAAGSFGFLVTVGLFLHELYNIEWCYTLWDCGEALEKRVLNGDAQRGVFLGAPDDYLGGAVSAKGAALVIYPAMLGAWTYVAFAGLPGAHTFCRAALVFAITMVASGITGGVVLRRWRAKDRQQQRVE